MEGPGAADEGASRVQVSGPPGRSPSVIGTANLSLNPAQLQAARRRGSSPCGGLSGFGIDRPAGRKRSVLADFALVADPARPEHAQHGPEAIIDLVRTEVLS